MRIVPIRYVADVAACRRFYEALGLSFDTASRPGSWVELTGGGSTLALHAASDRRAGECELSLETDVPLEELSRRLVAAGVEPGPILDENHGRSMILVDPDGVPVQVNESDRSLFT